MAKDKASQEEIYRQMRQDIEQGSYEASSRLPSVRTLAKRFNASPNTISKVVSRLMESGLCTARRGVGLFVRSLPSHKLTLIVGSHSSTPGDDFDGYIEQQLQERLAAEGIEIERYHIMANDPPYGPAIERIRRPGRVMLCMGLTHEPYLKALADLRRPMLVIGHAPNRCSASTILPNSFRSGYLAARHLIRRGRRNIAFVGRRRTIRQVSLTESEALKELAGVQAAFNEEGLNLKPEFIFPDISVVTERLNGNGELPDAVIMPASEGVGTIQAMKSLGGKIDRVVLGDERVLEKPRRPAAVVLKREDVVDLAVMELQRLFSDDRRVLRNYMVDTELYEELG